MNTTSITTATTATTTDADSTVAADTGNRARRRRLDAARSVIAIAALVGAVAACGDDAGQAPMPAADQPSVTVHDATGSPIATKSASTPVAALRLPATSGNAVR